QTVAEEALHVVILHDAVPAEHLHARARDANGFLGGEVLCQRHELAHVPQQPTAACRERWSPRVRLDEAVESVTETEYQVVCDRGLHPQCAERGYAGFHVEQHLSHEWVLTDQPVHLDALRGIRLRRRRRCY